MIDLADVPDENLPLVSGLEKDENGVNIEPHRPIKGGLWDPSSKIVSLVNYIYQQESFVYIELNRACRFKDESKIPTLGPFAKAFSVVIAGAQKYRTDINICDYFKCELWRGAGMTEQDIKEFIEMLGKQI